jgi:hypothetical protein
MSTPLIDRPADGQSSEPLKQPTSTEHNYLRSILILQSLFHGLKFPAKILCAFFSELHINHLTALAVLSSINHEVPHYVIVSIPHLIHPS